MPEVDRVLYGMSISHILFLAALTGLLTYYQAEILFDIRLTLYPVLLLPTVGVLLTVTALVFVVRSVASGEGGRFVRALRIWTAVVGCAFIWFLSVSNLTGFRV